jgi:hypothetical protein
LPSGKLDFGRKLSGKLLARPKISLTFYKALAEAFRKAPGNIPMAAKEVGCSKPTARKGWNKGWDFPWAGPIKVLVETEQLTSRAARVQGVTHEAVAAEVERLVGHRVGKANEETAKQVLVDLEAARTARAETEKIRAEWEAKMAAADADGKALLEKAREKAEAEAKLIQGAAEKRAQMRIAELLDAAKVDAALSAKAEAEGTKLGTDLARAQLGFVAQFYKQGEMLQKKFEMLVNDPNFKTSPRAILTMAKTIVHMTAWAERSWEIALKNERLHSGKPTDIVQIQSDSVPVEEQERMAAAYTEAVQRRKRREELEKQVPTVLGAQPPPADANGTGNGVLH